MPRAQLSLSLLEAGVATLLILAVAGLFVLGPADPPTDNHLDRYAGDLETVLADPGPESVPIDHLLGSRESFEEHQESVMETVRSVLPPTLSYRLETDQGTIGDPRPVAVHTGTRRIVTANGTATLWVWYT